MLTTSLYKHQCLILPSVEILYKQLGKLMESSGMGYDEEVYVGKGGGGGGGGGGGVWWVSSLAL